MKEVTTDLLLKVIGEGEYLMREKEKFRGFNTMTRQARWPGKSSSLDTPPGLSTSAFPNSGH
jgi:hypothetical protein